MHSRATRGSLSSFLGLTMTMLFSHFREVYLGTHLLSQAVTGEYNAAHRQWYTRRRYSKPPQRTPASRFPSTNKSLKISQVLTSFFSRRRHRSFLDAGTTKIEEMCWDF